MQPIHISPAPLIRSLGAAAVLLSTLTAVACAPNQDAMSNDQCPDVNYSVTELKDAAQLGTNDDIDNAVISRMQGKFPGCAVGIVDQGEIVYLKGYGVADFNVKANPFDDDDFTVNTVAGIGSVSKVLTAIATMRLEEMGHIDLDNDPISQFFPHWVPAAWDNVTVRDLLSHRGGFVWDPNPNLAGARTAAQVDALFGQPHSSQHPRHAIYEFLNTTDAEPIPALMGKFSYSNVGYTILGAVVDQITSNAFFPGGPVGYEHFVWSLLSGAQDACLTGCLDQYWRIGDIPNLAQSYDGGWLELDTDYSGWQGPSGGWSVTIGDLSRLLIALDDNQILTSTTLQDMRTNPGALAPNTPDYGLGLFLEDKAGREAYHHGGAIDGFRTQIIMWPNEQVGVAAFCNAKHTGVDAIATAVGNIYMDTSGGIVFNLSDEDLMKMRTAAYQVSSGHFEAAEATVLEMIERYGSEKAGTYLRQALERQGTGGQELIRLAEQADVEGASQAFLDLLAAYGYAGPYRPAQ